MLIFNEDLLNMENLVNYWRISSIDDFESAKDIFSRTHRITQALFFLHLAIEKALKALVVFRTNQHAPLTHNLLSLATKAQIDLSTDQRTFLAEVNEFNLECRYPEDIQELKQKATQAFANFYFQKGEIFHLWILEQLK